MCARPTLTDILARFAHARELMSFAALVVLAACGGVTRSSVPTNNPPSGTASVQVTTVATGLDSPIDLQQPVDSTGRLFVVQQGGAIRIISNGAVLGTPFLDITPKVTSGGEMGLLGMAFHPGYADNGRFFVHYDRTVNGGPQSVIAEYHVSATDPNRADPNSERILLTLDQPFANHNGGQITFGPDNFLYIGFGDGGGQGDPNNNGQNTQTLLGKILRIDVDSSGTGTAYGIPGDNPFAGGGGRPEIYAYGFRNPWRLSFDRGTGTLFAADVGESSFEEVDIVTRGGNYGWSIMEASHCFKPSSGCNSSGLIMPIAEYGRDEGQVTIGGYVYRGNTITALQGAYLFGDFGSGRIWTLVESTPGNWTRTLLLQTGRNISSFGQDQAGEIYVVDISGTVLKIAPK